MVEMIILGGVILMLLVDKVLSNRKELELIKRHNEQLDKLIRKLIARDLTDYTTNSYYENHGPSTALIPKDALSQALTQLSSDMVEGEEEVSII